MMSDGILHNAPAIIRTYNVSRSISITTGIYSASLVNHTAIPIIKNSDISLAQCIGFSLLILTTVIGNTLVLSALFLDKRLHSPSFFLIANMAIADLLLGLSVLPFSSVHELLNDRWIFGKSFCTAWLALDVLCCTASIMALMAVSIDRYIGVTRPLNYGSIMTIKRTIYLIIIVWALSILTSVVPLFGLTDQGQNSHHGSETCEVNKNTFYTIFSSLISFYIPVIILLILYSRVYQEAKKQGEKLENEKRRLYEIDYQIASKHAREKQNHSNGLSTKPRVSTNQLHDNKNEVSAALLNHENIPDDECSLDRTLTSTDGIQLKNACKDLKNTPDDDTSHSGSSLAAAPPQPKPKHRSLRKRVFSTIKRNSLLHTPQASQYDTQLPLNDELVIIKKKLHNLKREKKAFRTVGLILGALLICWLPFFVTLPVMSILTHHGIIKEENSENTWFKIAFWLGYCNSAFNPFVYAFSNRAIRRAFRQVIFRHCCCCICRKPTDEGDEQNTRRRHRAYSGSLTTDISQIFSKGPNASLTEVVRTIPETENDHDTLSNLLNRVPTTNIPAISFADFLEETGDDDISSQDDKESNQDLILTTTKEHLTSTSDT